MLLPYLSYAEGDCILTAFFEAFQAESKPADLHVDWARVAYLALVSRLMDEAEEAEGFVKYQFSARGHELGQILLSQQLTYPFDAASVYYRSRPFMLGSGLTIQEAFEAGVASAGGISDGRDVGVAQGPEQLRLVDEALGRGLIVHQVALHALERHEALEPLHPERLG